VTTVNLAKDDCHNISGKYSPKREVIDRIGEASGIVFNDVRGHTETIDDPATGKSLVFIGNAQGKVSTSDGSWRTSSLQEYDFDPTLRAMLDNNVTELTPATRKHRKKDKWGKEGRSTDELIMEYRKHGKQRAQTGARLRVIRELTRMSTALTAEQISKPLVFVRIVQNTGYILGTPEGKAMATAQALGVDMAVLFGKNALGAPEAEARKIRDVTPFGRCAGRRRRGFPLEYTYNGWKPGVNEQIISMAANASGIRDTARVLKVSKRKVSDTLKKRKKRQARSTSST